MKKTFTMASLLLLGVSAGAFAQTLSALDGMTPVGLQPGSPAGSYVLSGLDTINLYNGSGNVAIPLLEIGGRGEAGYTMLARYDAHWDGVGLMSTNLPGCTELSPCPMWAFTAGGAPTGPHSYRPVGITVRRLGEHPRPIYVNGSSTPFCYANTTTLTRISLTFADGTELTLVDTIAGGTPVSMPFNASSCNLQGFDRGTTFVSTDGSAATFVAENHIYDVNTPGSSTLPGETTAGTLFLRDGRQFHFGDYHVYPTFPSLTTTVIDRIRDRNGNQTTFDYSVPVPNGFQSGFAVTDPLGRVINVAEGNQFAFPDSSCTGGICNGTYDQITYGTTGQQKTITIYRRDYWYDRLSSLQDSTRPTYQNLFGGYASPSAGVFSWAIWKIVLPDNHTYQLRYDQYAEVARLDLPTGGHYEFDWVNGYNDPYDICIGNPHPGDPENNKCPIIRAGAAVQASFDNNSGYDLLFAVYRRVRERREYIDAGSSWTRRSYYTVEELPSGQGLEDPLGQCGLTTNTTFVSGYCSRVTVEDYDPDPALGLLSRQRHYFYGAVSRYQSLFPQIGWYSWWLEGKEFRTDVVRPSDGIVLKKQLQTWQPRAIPSWWQAAPSSGPQPALDPRVGSTDIIIDGGKMSRTVLGYSPDDTSNVADVWEYDYGSTSGSQGSLLRHVHTDYVTTYNNPGLGVYVRALPLAEVVYDPSSNTVAQTQFGYDESVLVLAPGIVQNVAVPAQRGNVTHVSRWRNTDGALLTTTKNYDVAGNVIGVMNPGGDATSYTYTDCLGMYAYLSQVTNAAGHTTTFGHNCTFGQITSITDANGFLTTALYNDVLERVTNVFRPNGQRIVYSYSPDLASVTTTTDQYASPIQQMVSSVVNDGLGRMVETRLGTISTKRDLDPFGRVKKQYNPGSTTDGTSYRYDALGRVTAITYADGSPETFDWTGDSVVHSDPASKRSKRRIDALGRTVELTEDSSAQNPLITTYLYDELDDLITVLQGAQTRSFRYDSLRQLVSVINPEIGAVVPGCLSQTVSECYSYDANGNLFSKAAAGVVTTFQYDPLNRLKKKIYSDGTPQVDYAYDTIQKGCLDSVSNSVGGAPVATMTYTAYDANCVIRASRQSVNGQSYSFTYAYNLATQLIQETFPSGRVVTYHYNALGQTDRIGNGALSGQNSYATNITYAPHGALAQMQLGVTASNPTGWIEMWQYDPKRLQPTSVDVKNGLVKLQFYYCVNGGSICSANNGNMLRQVVTRSGSSWTQDYTTYDAMNRLMTAQESSSSGSWSQTYDYDRYGNWWLADQAGSLTAPTNETPRNATWYLPSNRLAGWGYNDGRGNVTSILNMSRDFTYDGENRQKTATINGSTFSYSYDGEGRRISKTAGGVTTTYVYDAFNRLIAEYGGSNPISGTQYLSIDHLGSTRLVTDASGVPVTGGCHDFLPFGGEIVAGINGRGACFPAGPVGGAEFTGKMRESETGLSFFGARYYSAAQARFMSPDGSAMGIALADPQSWNLYSYVRNRPLTFVDTQGKWSTPLHRLITQAALEGYLSAGDLRQIQARHKSMDSMIGQWWSGQPVYEHAMAAAGQNPDTAELLWSSFVALNLRVAAGALGPGSGFTPRALSALGDALHAVQDYTSPEHTSVSGRFLQWSGYLSPTGVVSHFLGEDSPTDGWFRIGQAIRLTMAAFLQANPEGARKSGLTEQNFDREANRRIVDFVHTYFRETTLGWSVPGTVAKEEAARLCALGNPAACGL